MDRFRERGVDRLLRFPQHQRQRGDLDDIAKARELCEGFLRRRGEPLELPSDELHHVVGVVLGADAIHVPLPRARGRVEREQPLFGQLREELDREKRIPAGLLVYQPRQGARALRLAMEGVGDESADIVEPEGRQHDPMHTRIGFADRLERPQKWVRGADLVIPVSANDQ